MTPYGDIYLGHHCLWLWQVTRWHQAVTCTWTNFYLTPARSSHIHNRIMFTSISKISNPKLCFTHVTSQPNFPGASELLVFFSDFHVLSCCVWRRKRTFVSFGAWRGRNPLKIQWCRFRNIFHPPIATQPPAAVAICRISTLPKSPSTKSREIAFVYITLCNCWIILKHCIEHCHDFSEIWKLMGWCFIRRCDCNTISIP